MAKLPEFDIRALAFLLVDDDEYMRHSMADVLRSLGVRQIEQAGDGQAALKALDTFNPDIIMTEWLLPGMSGVELTRHIRWEEGSPHRMTPIIIVTAHTQIGHVTKAREAGMTEYLAKPISAKSLYARICSVVMRPRPFIESDGFVGPDRRRKHDPFLVGQSRRDEDKFMPQEAGGIVNEDEINAMLGL